MKNISIFTDGAARGNPGPGGWGAVVTSENHVEELGGFKEHTTNNRMELSGVIHALAYVERHNMKGTIVIHTDSSYVLNGSTKWVHDWQKNNWKTKTKKAVLNQDLWEKLLKLIQQPRLSLGTQSAEAKPRLHIEWKLLKGHAGTAGNERCDAIATSFADGTKPKLYSGLLEKYPIDLKNLSVTKNKPQKAKSNSAKAYSYVSSINGVVKTHATWAECEKRVKGVSGTKFKKSFSKEDESSLIKLWIGKR